MNSFQVKKFYVTIRLDLEQITQIDKILKSFNEDLPTGMILIDIKLLVT